MLPCYEAVNYLDLQRMRVRQRVIKMMVLGVDMDI